MLRAWTPLRALPLGISIPNSFDTPTLPMVPQTSLPGSPAPPGSFVHGFSPFPHSLSCPVKHSWCSLPCGVRWHCCHQHFRASTGLCANTSLSPAPGVWLPGGSGCVAATALPMLLYPPSLYVSVVTARRAASVGAPFQKQLPPASPRLSSPHQAPQHSPSTGWPWLQAEGRFFSLPSCRLTISSLT